MTVATTRPATLHDVLLPGWELDSTPALIERWAAATDLPGPVHGIGPADGPVTAAWCPRCLEPATGWDYDAFFARPTDLPATPAAAQMHVGAMLTLSACGHAFRIQRGQTIFEIRDADA